MNPEQFTFNEGWDDSPCWSPDSTRILYMSDKSGNWDIWTKLIDDEIFEQITFDEALDASSDYSSDGSKMVFISHRNENNPNVWIKTFSNTGIIDNNKTISLANYPNPFNKSTTIEYKLLTKSKVSLKIYDLSGKEIKNLVDEYQLQGEKNVIWDGTDSSGKHLHSGFYNLQLKVNGKRFSNKLILNR